MDHVRLGKTGLKVSRLCLGCMSFGTPGGPTHPWVITEDEAQPFFRKAVESGINFYDTANHYNFGDSEEITGRALKTYARTGGVGFVSPEEPRGNLTGDPWFTDGYRAVMLLTADPTSVDEIDWFNWTKDDDGEN